MFPVSSESERFSPVISKEWSEIPGRLNAPFQSRISSESSKQGHAKRMNPAVSTWQKVSFILFFFFNIIQLYCLYVEKFAFWLVIYIKTINKINNKTSTTQWNTELKTAQIQGKYLTITMYTYTHARSHPLTSPHTHYSHIIFIATWVCPVSPCCIVNVVSTDCDTSLSGLSRLYRKCGLYRLSNRSLLVALMWSLSPLFL